MIPLKINGKKLQIKEPKELTMFEFMELEKIGDIDHLKYISYITDIDYKIIWGSKVSQTVIDLISFPDADKLPLPRFILNKPVKRYLIDLVGQRFQIEICERKGLDLLVFVCAVALARSNDYTEVESVYDRLLKLPYIEVFPVARFFFLHLQNGRNAGGWSFRSISRSIRTKLLRAKQGLKS